MKKKYKLVNGKFVEKKSKMRVEHVLTVLMVLVIASLIYVNV